MIFTTRFARLLSSALFHIPGHFTRFISDSVTFSNFRFQAPHRWSHAKRIPLGAKGKCAFVFLSCFLFPEIKVKQFIFIGIVISLQLERKPEQSKNEIILLHADLSYELIMIKISYVYSIALYVDSIQSRSLSGLPLQSTHSRSSQQAGPLCEERGGSGDT